MPHLRRIALVLAATLASASTAHAQQTILFDSDPFFGSTALTDPGRQIVGGELFTSFTPATDFFAFNTSVFGAYGIGSINFATGVIGSIPTTGVNAIVLQTFDNDADPGTAFTVGLAANMIADRLTTPGAGFFLYFNSGLDLPRLVFSTDLSDNTADLKILARLTNLSGQDGRDAFSSFTADNFVAATSTVPEPSTLLLMATGLMVLGAGCRFR